MFSNPTTLKSLFSPRGICFFSVGLQSTLIVFLLFSSALHAGNPAQKKQNSTHKEAKLQDKRNAKHEAAKEKLAPRKLNAHVDPQKVPFGGVFHLVITFERPKGAPYSLSPTLPSTKTVRAAPTTMLKIEHDVVAVESIKGTLRPDDIEKDAKADGVEPDAAKVGEVKWMRETYRIPFLALDLDSVKTPELLLKNDSGQTLDIPSLSVDVDDEATEAVPSATGTGSPKDLTSGPASPNAGQRASTAPTFSMSAGPQTFVVDDVRPWVVLGILLLAVFFTLAENRLRKLRRFQTGQRKKKQSVVVEEQVSAHDRALARLDALLAEGLLKRGEVATFVTRLMDEVLRDYLATRFSIATEQQTTKELAEELLDVGHVRLDIPLVRDLLEDADMVKFAKATLQVDVASKMAGKVRALIEDTRRREVT